MQDARRANEPTNEWPYRIVRGWYDGIENANWEEEEGMHLVHSSIQFKARKATYYIIHRRASRVNGRIFFFFSEREKRPAAVGWLVGGWVDWFNWWVAV